jgi:hypothetical protein
VDERVAVDCVKDFFKVKVKREIVPDKCLIRAFEHEGRALLSASDHPVPDNPAPPAIAPAIPAEDLPAPECLVKGERLVRVKYDPRHDLFYPVRYLRLNFLEYGPGTDVNS